MAVPPDHWEYPPVDDSVRKLWLQRCRGGASIPAYLIVNMRLNELFEFAPDPDKRNGDFYFAIREILHGPPPLDPR
jgi:hypothetical protein